MSTFLCTFASQIDKNYMLNGIKSNIGKLKKYVESLGGVLLSESQHGSAYYNLDGFKIRISDHLPIQTVDDELMIVCVEGSTSYIVSLDKRPMIVETMKEVKFLLKCFSYVQKAKVFREDSKEKKRNKELYEQIKFLQDKNKSLIEQLGTARAKTSSNASKGPKQVVFVRSTKLSDGEGIYDLNKDFTDKQKLQIKAFIEGVSVGEVKNREEKRQKLINTFADACTI